MALLTLLRPGQDLPEPIELHMTNQQELIKVITCEIADRTIQKDECGDAEYEKALSEEIDALHLIKTKVETSTDLTLNECIWVVDMVVALKMDELTN